MFGLAVSGFDARRRHGAEFAVCFLAAGRLASRIGQIAGRYRHPLLCPLIPLGAGLSTALMFKHQPSECQQTVRQKKSGVQDEVLDFRGRTYCLQYSKVSAVEGLGAVTVNPKGVEVPTSADFANFLDDVEEFASQRRARIDGSFVVYFDSTNLVWPSMFSLPQIVAVLRERQPPVILKDRTEAIAIIHRDSHFLTMIVTYLVDIVMALMQPELMPVFATSRDAAENLVIAQIKQQRLGALSAV